MDFKSNDQFKITAVLHQDLNIEPPIFEIYIKELQSWVDGRFDCTELEEAFDPAWEEKKKQERINQIHETMNKLAEELNKLEN